MIESENTRCTRPARAERWRGEHAKCGDSSSRFRTSVSEAARLPERDGVRGRGERPQPVRSAGTRRNGRQASDPLARRGRGDFPIAIAGAGDGVRHSQRVGCRRGRRFRSAATVASIGLLEPGTSVRRAVIALSSDERAPVADLMRKLQRAAQRARFPLTVDGAGVGCP